MTVNLEEMFNSLNGRSSGGCGSIARVFFNIIGHKGGLWSIEISDGNMIVKKEESYLRGETVVGIDAKILSSIVTGQNEKTFESCFTSGEIRMDGNTGVALKLLRGHLFLDGLALENSAEKSGVAGIWPSDIEQSGIASGICLTEKTP